MKRMLIVIVAILEGILNCYDYNITTKYEESVSLIFQK